MFIQTETTPNPATLKFLPGEPVLTETEGIKTADYRSAAAVDGHSPLADTLFRITGVTGVFLGGNFISVSKEENADWDVLKPLLLTTIMEHYVAGLPVYIANPGDHEGRDAASAPTEEDFDETDRELVAQIKELLDTRVRPAVAMDGGDIIFRGFREGVVQLELHGACSGCPSSTITLKNGIENMLRHYVPEVETVEAVM